MRFVSIALALLAPLSANTTGALPKQAAKQLLKEYQKKFVVVLRSGLEVGICSSRPGPAGNYGGLAFAFPYLTITVSGKEAEPEVSGWASMDTSCGPVIQEPLDKGEVLKVTKASLHGDKLSLQVETVNPHAVQRGVGALMHRSLEEGTAAINFVGSKGGNADGLPQAIAAWLKPFDTAWDAARFGNTASMVFVKEIKLGMSFAQVEQVLGPPQAKIDLGTKVLYKYSNMTVEFRDGRVTNVK